MKKLDRKDRIILYELDRDARQPLSEIAKKATLSRESVLYRMRRYLKDGIIRNFLALIDCSMLGFSHYKVFVKLHNISEEEEKELVSSLSKNPRIMWAASCDGKYSLIFAVRARSLEELRGILKEIRSRNWRFFMIEDIAPIVSAAHFYRKYLLENAETAQREIVWGLRKEPVKLDGENIGILDGLAENPRIGSVELAKRLKISPDAVLQRIRKLEKSGIIKHYMIWPDVNKLKGAYYKVLVSLREMGEEQEKKLAGFCLGHPNIVYTVNTFGGWQFEMDVEVDETSEFRAFMRKFLQKFSDVVSDYSALNIYEEHKFRFFEKEMLEEGVRL